MNRQELDLITYASKQKTTYASLERDVMIGNKKYKQSPSCPTYFTEVSYETN